MFFCVCVVVWDLAREWYAYLYTHDGRQIHIEVEIIKYK